MTLSCPRLYGTLTPSGTTRVVAYADESLHVLEVPLPHRLVLPGIHWGRFDTLYTAAFWRSQVWFDSLASGEPCYALGRTLIEEVGACLLGGYGIPAEIGLAAYEQLRAEGLLRSHVGGSLREKIEHALMKPLELGNRTVLYRFARQKSAYLAGAVGILSRSRPPRTNDRTFRDWLLRIPGVGPKTASWITRNYLGSGDVAILDVHIVRAGRLLSLFAPDQRVERDYAAMESRYLSFSRALGVSAAALDAAMWREMRAAGHGISKDHHRQSTGKRPNAIRCECS